MWQEQEQKRKKSLKKEKKKKKKKKKKRVFGCDAQKSDETKEKNIWSKRQESRWKRRDRVHV